MKPENSDSATVPRFSKPPSLLLGLGLAFVGCLIAVVILSNFWARPRRASKTEYGVFNFPAGKYLCLEYWAEQPGEGLWDFPYYRYDGLTLQGFIYPAPVWTADKVFIGYGMVQSKEVAPTVS